MCVWCDSDSRISGEKKVWKNTSGKMTLMECKNICVSTVWPHTCTAVDYGKAGRAGECYLNFNEGKKPYRRVLLGCSVLENLEINGKQSDYYYFMVNS